MKIQESESLINQRFELQRFFFPHLVYSCVFSGLLPRD